MRISHVLALMIAFSGWAGAAEKGGVDFVALRRAVEDLRQSHGQGYPRADQFLAKIEASEKRVTAARAKLLARDARSAAALAEAEWEARQVQREALLANPLLNFEKLLVVKRSAARLGLPQNWQGNCALPRTGYDNEIAALELRSGKFKTLYRPEGARFVGDVDLHFDADKMLFSMTGKGDRWQVWEIKVNGTGLRQVTAGEEPDVDNYDACYRPDGKILYCSTMAFAGVPCVGGSNTVANMAVMDADGKNVRQLTFDQDHNWCPTILHDGRVMYTRWEYSDRAHYFSRVLMRMNPDGTGQSEYYGSNSYWPNSLFYARPVPGHATKVVGIVSGHHGVARMGELLVLDPAAGQREADGALVKIGSSATPVEAKVKDGLVQDSWPKFLHPYPLSEKYILTACQPGPKRTWGIYLVDVFDNMVLLAEEKDYALLEPLPLRKSEKPPIVPDRVDLASREATVYVADVYTGPGLKGIPRGTVKRLRVSSLHYAYPRMGGHREVGVEGPWDVRRIIGTVPVAEDGSAYFRAPANTPLVLQPLDEEGRALQIMRSWLTAMPGENVSCAGCHENQGTAVPQRDTMALRAEAVAIAPWYGPERGFSFKREVQPVLNRYCVGCHDGKAADAKGLATIDLSAKDKPGANRFDPAYLALHPFVRRPGPESDERLQEPMEFHASTSELVQMLKKGHHGVKLDAESWERIYTWIDLNVPNFGTWSERRGGAQNFHERRLAMRTKYANRPENPEAIAETGRGPVAFEKPVEAKRQTQRPPVVAGWPFDESEAKKRQAVGGGSVRRTIDIDGEKVELVRIPAGDFVMGDEDGDADARPVCVVKIERPFWMSTTEVTNRLFARFDPQHHSGFVDMHHKDHNVPGYPANLPDQPVVRVSWQKAMAFAKWLGERTGAKAALPSEAQWEWACRAGSAQPFWYGGMDADFGTCANLADRSVRLLAVNGTNPKPIANPSPFEDFIPKDARFDDGEKVVCAVGKYRANAWGLLDMHGNVAEWTRSDYRAYPYRASDGREGLSATAEKVARGGSFRDRPARTTAAFRLGYKSYQPVHNVGIRLVVEE